GPGRSWRIATGRPTAADAARTRAAFSACRSRSPWEKFRRATSSPAATIRASVSGSREAGPMVATIFVRRIANQSTGPRGNDSLIACERSHAAHAVDKRAAAGVSTGRPLLRERAVLHDRLAVGAEPAAVAQIADEVPVQRGVVGAARLGIGAAQR